MTNYRKFSIVFLFIVFVFGVVYLIYSSDRNTDYSMINDYDDKETETITVDKDPLVIESEIMSNEENLKPDDKEKDVLTANTWLWSKTEMSDGTVIFPKNKDGFSLTFSSENFVSGTTDCNNFSGGYTLADSFLSFGALAMTQMYCEGSQESEFLKMVTQSNSVFFTEKGQLVLLLPYDSGSVIFEKKK